MGVFAPKDSPWFWFWLEGFTNAKGRPLRERSNVRADAPTPALRTENRKLAERRFHERMTQLARESTAAAKPAMTVRDFATWWTRHKLPARRGREREGFTLPKLVTTFGDYHLAAITRALVAERWITPRREAGAAAATINREVDVLKTLLQAAVPEYLAASPLYGMKRLAAATPKRRLMSPEEEAKLLAVMAPDDKALFLLALDGLVRLTDCLDVKRADDQGTSIWIADPKAGGGFAVPVSRRVREAIDAMPSDLVYRGRKLTGGQVRAIRAMLATSPTLNKAALGRSFGVTEAMIRKLARADLVPNAGEHLFPRRRLAKTERDRRRTIASMLKRYCRLADLPYGRKTGGLTFHWSTRRTGATRMLTRHVDVGTVQKIGRWKTPDVVLGIYHELIDDKARAAVEAVAEPADPDPERGPSVISKDVGKPRKTSPSGSRPQRPQVRGQSRRSVKNRGK